MIAEKSTRTVPETLADLHPDGLYTAIEVAHVLGVTVDTVYRLGQTPKMPRTPLGLGGGRSKWLGRIVIHYAQPDCT